jgi:hypothetical protein
MPALPDSSSFLGAHQPTGMSDCHENGDPLTRPTTADESAVAGHPLPQGGEGSFYIFIHSGGSKDHEVFAQDDRSPISSRLQRGGSPFSYIVVSRRIMKSSLRMTAFKGFCAACRGVQDVKKDVNFDGTNSTSPLESTKVSKNELRTNSKRSGKTCCEDAKEVKQSEGGSKERRR